MREPSPLSCPCSRSVSALQVLDPFVFPRCTEVVIAAGAE